MIDAGILSTFYTFWHVFHGALTQITRKKGPPPKYSRITVQLFVTHPTLKINRPEVLLNQFTSQQWTP